MKLFIAFLVVVGGIFLAVSCGTSPTPPAPVPPGPPPIPPAMEFVVNGKTVIISGHVKAGAVITVDEAKRSMKTAADLIDSAK